jgi:hypothetical protein
MRICPKSEKCHYNWLEILHGCHSIVILGYSLHYTIEQTNKTK